MSGDYETQQAIIVMEAFGWIDNGPCTCGLEIYDDPCPHHSAEAMAERQVLENVRAEAIPVTAPRKPLASNQLPKLAASTQQSR